MENVTVDMLENILIRFHKIDYDHDTFPFLIYSEFVEFLYSGEFNSVLKDEERSVESQHATLRYWEFLFYKYLFFKGTVGLF